MGGYPKFFRCGCKILDVAGNWTNIVDIRFYRCKKHKKEFKICSWSQFVKESHKTSQKEAVQS